MKTFKRWLRRRKIRRQFKKQAAIYQHTSMVNYCVADAQLTMSLYNKYTPKAKNSISNTANTEFFEKVEDYRNDFTG